MSTPDDPRDHRDHRGLPDGPAHDHGDLAELRAEAHALAAELPGPLARIKLSRGDATLEVEWQVPAPAIAPGVAPGWAWPADGPGWAGVVSAGAGAVSAGAGAGSPGARAGSPGAGNAAYGTGVGSEGSAYGTGPGLAAVPDAPDGTAVTAPLVGTFYRSASPDAAPFVAPGDRVEAGQQVAIVEAMKLLNSIEAPVAGTVGEILAADGEMVEFGQVLLNIQED